MARLYTFNDQLARGMTASLGFAPCLYVIREGRVSPVTGKRI